MVLALLVVAVLVIGWLYARVKREDDRLEATTLPDTWRPPRGER